METIAGLEVEKLREVALQEFGKDDYDNLQQVACMVATAHCAKVSYNNHGAGVDYKKDIKLFKRLKKEGHMSPFEHCARAMSGDETRRNFRVNQNSEGKPVTSKGWSGNFRGFVQLRKEIE